MSDHPPPPPTDQPATGKGAGITLGCLTVPVAAIAGSLIGVATGLAFVAVALPVVLLVAAVFYGRRMPGFLRGIAWFFGIAAILFTACVGIIAASGGF